MKSMQNRQSKLAQFRMAKQRGVILKKIKVSLKKNSK